MQTEAAHDPHTLALTMQAALAASHADVWCATGDAWPAQLAARRRGGVRRLLLDPAAPNPRRSPALPDTVVPVPFDRPIDAWKTELFDTIDAGFTVARSGIAATGTVVLHPMPARRARCRWCRRCMSRSSMRTRCTPTCTRPCSAGTPACRPTSCWYRRRKRPTSSRRSPMARTARAARVVIVTETGRRPGRHRQRGPPPMSDAIRAATRRSRAAQELSRRDGLPARQARDAVPDDTELQQLRDLGEAVRQHALAQLPALLERLETKLTEAGVHVHWAETAAEANAIVLGIAQAKKARRVIKGKSMASEEIELNHALAEHGVDCIESDMGEFIVQLAGEKPSHIVMPAIHKTRGDIAELFQEHIPGTRYTEDVDELIQTGRRARAFAEADIGLSGVNFAAADTGTLARRERRQRPPVDDGARHARRDHGDREGRREARAHRAAVEPAHALGHRPGDHDLLQPDLSRAATANATARASCISCCSTTAARRPTRTSSCARRCSASAAARA